MARDRLTPNSESSSASYRPVVLPGASFSLTPAPARELGPGFRFCPTDEELVSYYLKRRVSNKHIQFNPVTAADVYGHEPWRLGGMARFRTRDEVWYFYCMLDKKSGNGERLNRTTGSGYWKSTGRDRKVRRDSGPVIGYKKTLVYHIGRSPSGQRTDWVMHEYRLSDEELANTEDGARLLGDRSKSHNSSVLCRIFHKNYVGKIGSRYAPFREEEWVNIDSEEDAADEVVVRAECNHPFAGTDEDRQDTHSPEEDPIDGEVIPTRAHGLPSGLTAGLNMEPLDSTVHSEKGHKYDDEARPSHVFSPAQATEVQTATKMSADAAISALLDFSLLIPVAHRTGIQPELDAASLDLTLPPSTLAYVAGLQHQVHRLSIESERLKNEMFSIHVFSSILNSRIESLSKENEDLRKRRKSGCS